MTLSNILILSALVFLIGLFGTLTKKSAVIVIMSLELMFNSVAVSFVAFSRFAPGGFLGVESASRVLSGHIMAIFIIAIGAAEVALALSLVIALYREKSSIELTNSVDVREF